MSFYTLMESPIDTLLIRGDGDAVTGIFMATEDFSSLSYGLKKAPVVFKYAVEQLCAYFAGELMEFDLPLAPCGTDFQQQVWLALRKIPFGETVSYQAIADAIGKPKAVRAVGAANGKNPLPIVVPCHRVIGSNGTLTGFAGGLGRKQWLLQHEQRRRQNIAWVSWSVDG